MSLTNTIKELQYRLKPGTLASDAWNGVRSSGSEVAGKGMHAMTGHPGAAGGVVAAIALFLLRGPLANLLTRIFSGESAKGRVTTKLTHKDDDFDLTAPVVTKV